MKSIINFQRYRKKPHTLYLFKIKARVFIVFDNLCHMNFFQDSSNACETQVNPIKFENIMHLDYIKHNYPTLPVSFFIRDRLLLLRKLSIGKRSSFFVKEVQLHEMSKSWLFIGGDQHGKFHGFACLHCVVSV